VIIILEFKISECGLTRYFKLWHCKYHNVLWPITSMHIVKNQIQHSQGSTPHLCECNPDDLHFAKKYSVFKLELLFLFVFGSKAELLLVWTIVLFLLYLLESSIFKLL